jgi:hypothetical protein
VEEQLKTMKKTHFSALGLEVKLDENQHYHDDGLVENLDVHRERLDKKYGQRTQRIKGAGACYVYKYRRISFPPRFRSEIHVHIFYKASDVGIRGHEEAHALAYLGKLRNLWGRIKDLYGTREMAKLMIKLLLRRIQSRGGEYVGHIGTALALDSNNKVRSSKKLSFNELVDLIEGLYKQSTQDQDTGLP